MKPDNPYAAPQTPLFSDDRRNQFLAKSPVSAHDFRWFLRGSLFWLVGLLCFVFAVFATQFYLFLVNALIFLVATFFLTRIPRNSPGRHWFHASLALQVISPVILFLAIQDVPNPNWNQIAWNQLARHQCFGFWGAYFALLCVLIGLVQLANWLRYRLLGWSATTAVVFFGLCFFLEVWIRTSNLGLGSLPFILIWFFLGIIPLSLALFACWISALFVPDYVDRLNATSCDPNN